MDGPLINVIYQLKVSVFTGKNVGYVQNQFSSVYRNMCRVSTGIVMSLQW